MFCRRLGPRGVLSHRSMSRSTPGKARAATTLLESREPVTLVGAGPVGEGDIAAALSLAPVPVAADGGADRALPDGVRFAAVIGDMDSQRQARALAADGVPVHPVGEQDSTDLEKCLYSVEAPLFVGVGFLGGRIDHHMAAMGALVRYAAKPVLLVGREDVAFACPPRLDLELPAGTRVSLFPMLPVRGCLSEGLRWSVDGLELAPDGRVGTSNTASGGRVRVAFDRPGALVILPRVHLGSAAEALSAISRSR